MSFERRIVRKAARSLRAAAYRLGLEQLLYGAPKRKLITMYHGIDLRNCTDFNLRFCSVSDFRNQVRYFKKRFEVLPVKEFFDSRPGRHPQIAITFDDGYRNNFRYALPILAEENVPATFYTTSIRGKGYARLWADVVNIYSFYLTAFEWSGHRFTKDHARKRLFSENGNIELNAFVKALPFEEKLEVMQALENCAGFALEERRDLDDYWMLMNEEEIRQTAASGIVRIGSHGCLHSNLADLPVDEAVRELEHSKTWLERIAEQTVDELAYPDGSYTHTITDAAESMGFRYQLALDYLYTGDAHDPRLKDRIGIFTDRSWIEQLHQINCGLRT